MYKTDSIKNIAEAMVGVQAEMPNVVFDSKNPFYKNNYASLGAVIRTAKPILSKYGLAVVQHVTGDMAHLGVETVLMHKSGEWISDIVTLPINMEDKGASIAQRAGSIVTYLRRYALSAILGMYADEDSDDQQPDTPQAQPEAVNNQKRLTRPLDPETVKYMIQKKANTYGKKSVATVHDRQVLASALDNLAGGEDARHVMVEYLTGIESGSTKEIPSDLVLAIKDWTMCADFDEVSPPYVIKEAQAIMNKIIQDTEISTKQEGDE